MGRKIILLPNHFMSEEIQQYNNMEVEVEVIKEYHKGVFHVIFPNGFRTDNRGEGQGRIIAWNPNTGSGKYEEWWRECE
jgi:hypothetical protein